MLGLSDGFAQSAAQWPHRPCVVVGGTSWTYGELHDAQRQIAACLHEAGLDSSRIAIVGGKSLGIFAALLAALSTKSAYVPLNSRERAARFAQQLRTSGCAAVVCTANDRARLQEALEDPHLRLLELRLGPEMLLLCDLRDRHEPLRNVDGAYAIHTSGSTGIPKLVEISQSNVIAFLDAFSALFPVLPTDRVLQLADLAFDFSVGEMFPTWQGGGAVVCPVGTERLNLGEFCEHHGVTIWNSVPTVAASMVAMRAIRSQTTLRSVRRSIFCGETLPVSLADQWRQRVEHSEVLNLYGPTEATVFATWFRYTGGLSNDHLSVPIGAPLPGVEAHIQRSDGAHHGELLLSGPQVAEGCVCKEGPQAGWYPTGDLVRRSDEHGLLFLGRLDQQVKVAGYRVDLLEVELHVRRLSEGRQAAVVPVSLKNNLGTELVAFVEGECSKRDLHRACSDFLPKYMVPARFVYLDVFPRTKTGKIDRQQLASLAR